MVASVDDVELQQQADGTLAVTALLIGPGALGPRLGGVLGRSITAVWSRLSHKERTEPGRIDMALVADIGSAITLSVRKDSLDVGGFERWARQQIVEKIPGASHEPEE